MVRRSRLPWQERGARDSPLTHCPRSLVVLPPPPGDNNPERRGRVEILPPLLRQRPENLDTRFGCLGQDFIHVQWLGRRDARGRGRLADREDEPLETSRRALKEQTHWRGAVIPE